MANTENNGFDKFNKYVVTFSIIFGIVFGLWKFEFEDIIGPASQKPYLTIEPSFKKIECKRPDLQCFEYICKVKNKGKNRAYILGADYIFSGYHINDTSFKDNTEYDIFQRQNCNSSDYYPVSIFYLESDPQFIEYGKLGIDSLWLDPDEEITIQRLFYIPKNKFDEVNLFVKIDKSNFKRGNLVPLRAFNRDSSDLALYTAQKTKCGETKITPKEAEKLGVSSITSSYTIAL